MGGDPLPRRIAFAFASVATLALASAAGAQVTQSRLPAAQNRPDATPLTIIGAPNARACGRFAAAGDASDNALAACNRALSSENMDAPGVVATRINRGVVFLRRHDPQAALADFDFAIARDPENADAYVNRGSALMQLEQPGPAVAAFTDALTRGVQNPEHAYYNRGAAREALGDIRGAFEDYSTALEIQPDWGPANAELARFVRTRRERLAEFLNRNVPEPQ